MGCHLIFYVLLVLQTFFLFEVKTDEVEDSLLDYGIDVNDSKFNIINVIYDNTEVNPGDHIPSELTVQPPSVSWDTNPFYSYHTLFLLDLDAVTTDVPGLSNTQFVHWCVTNIVGNDVSSGTVLAGYVPPLPPPGTKFHNYIFLLFNHNYRKKCELLDREFFDIGKYEHNCRLGNPVAYNYFKGGVVEL